MRYSSLHRPKRGASLRPARPGGRWPSVAAAASGALPPTEPPRAVRAVPAATMQAFLDAWLDELPATDALRLGAACRSARQALGAGGVAAAAFAVTRPWRRTEPEGSLRLWRRAWGACASA